VSDNLNIQLDGSQIIKGVDDVLSALREFKAAVADFSRNDPTGRVRAEVQQLSTAAVTVVQSVERTLGGVRSAVDKAMNEVASSAKAGGKKIGQEMADGLKQGVDELRAKAASNIDPRTLLGLDSDRVRKSATASAEIFMEAFRSQSAGRLDPRELLGLTPEALVKSAALSAETFKEAFALEASRAKSASNIDARTLLGLTPEVMAKDAAASAAVFMQAFETEAMRARSASNVDARTLLGLTPENLAKSARASAEVFAAEFDASMARLAGTARAQFNAALASAAPGSFQLLGGGRQGLVPPNAKPELDSLTSSMKEAHSAARGLASGFDAIWLTWGMLGPLLAGAAVSNAFVQSIKKGSEFEKTLETIGYVAGASAQDLQDLSKASLDMAKDSQFGPNEIAKALKSMALAGLDARQQLEALKPVVNFAIVGEMSLEKAAESTVAISTAFGYAATGYSAVQDVIAKAAAVSMSSIESMTQSFRTASVVAQQYGVSVKDAATSLALLSQMGIKGQAAGTALRNMYNELIGSSKKARETMQDLLKVEVIDNATKAMKPLAQILTDISKSLSQYDFKSQLAILQQMGNERGMKALSADLTAFVTAAHDAGKDVTTEFQRIQQELEDAPGFVALAAAGMMTTTSAQMKSVGAALEAALVRSFNSVNSQAQITAQKLKEIFNSDQFQQLLQNIISSLGRLVEALAENATSVAAVASGYVLGKAALIGYEAAAGLAATASAVLGESALGASVGVRALMASLGPIGALLALGATAWIIFGNSSESALEKAQKAADAHSKSITEGIDKEIERLQAQIAARKEGLDGAIAQRKAEADLQVSRLMELDEEQLKIEEARHAQVLFNREKLAGSEYAKTVDGEKALKAADVQVEQSRLRIAELVVNNVEKENALREKQRQLINLAKQDAQEAEQAAEKARSVMTGNLKYTPPDYTGAGSAYANELKQINLIISAAREKAQAIDESSRVQEAFLKQSYDRGVISYSEYQQQLSTLQSDHESQRLALLDDEKSKVEAKIKDLQTKIEGMNPKTGPADRLRNDLEQLRQELARVNGEITKITDDGQIRAEQALTKLLAPAAEMVRNAEKEGAQIQNNYQQELARLAVKNNIVQLSEREQFVQAEIGKAVNRQEDELAKYMATLKDLLANVSDADLMTNPDVAGAIANLMKVIADASQRLTDMKANVAKAASEAFDAQKINEMAKSLDTGIADAIVQGGRDGRQKLRDVLEEELLRKPFKMVIEAMLQPVTNGLASAAYGMFGLNQSGTGPANSAGAGGGGANGLGMATQLFGSSFGASSIGLNSTLTQATISNGLVSGFGANMANIGTAIGSGAFADAAAMAIPYIGWAIAAYELLKGSFKGETRSGGQYGYSFDGTSVFNPRRDITQSANGIGATFLEGPSGGDQNQEAAKAALNGTYGIINNIFEGLGTNIRVTALQGGYESSDKGRGGVFTGGTLTGGINFGESGKGDNYAGTLYEKTSPQSLSVEQAFQNFLTDQKQSVIEALQAYAQSVGAQLPNAIRKLISGVDAESLSDTDAQALVDKINATIQGVKGFWDAVNGAPVQQLKNLAFDVADALVQASGGLEQFKSNLQSFVQNFYSPAEQRAGIVSSITKTLQNAGFNVTENQIASATRDQFRQLAESIDVTTDSGAKAYATLLSVAGAFASITTSSQDATQQLQDQTKNLQDQIKTLQDSQDTWKSTEQRLTDFMKSLTDFRDSLLQGDLSPLTPVQKYQQAGSDLQQLFAKAMSGDADAQSQFQAKAQEFLKDSQAVNASSDTYTSDFNMVMSMLSQLSTSATSQLTDAQQHEADFQQQITILQQQLDATQTQIDAIHNASDTITTAVQGSGIDIVSALQTINSTAQSIVAAVQQVVIPSTTPSSTSGGGSTTPDNSGGGLYYDGVTPDGQGGAFAAGGLASGWSLVGEEGPELVNFSNPGRVYTAAQTRAALGGGMSDQLLAQLLDAVNRLVEQHGAGTNASITATLQAADKISDAVGSGASRTRWSQNASSSIAQ
jgi:TP901 family phage tail tape measure protein